MRIVGIDPGLGGAIALLNGGELWAMADMPVLDKKVQTNPLAEILRGFRPDVVVLEDIHAMPRGSIASFSLGYTMGVVVATVQGLSLPLVRMRPNEWKKYQGLIGKQKEASRALAIERWPGFVDSLRRKKDCDRAEAALIADAYRRRENISAEQRFVAGDAGPLHRTRGSSRTPDGPTVIGNPGLGPGITGAG